MTTPSAKFPSLTVFFPCYNEEANVERTTLAAMTACDRLVEDYEVIIVNDGSSDRTGQIADRLARQHERVRAVHNRPNRGYGGALQRGFEEATKEWIFYTDGDGQFDFEEIDRLIPMLDKFDIVSAYRLDRQDSPIRKLNALCWGVLVNTLFGMRIRDIDCAFKIFPRSLFRQMRMESTGALIDTEILAKALRRGYRIGQIGVHHYPRTAGEQTGANFGVILRAFKELFALRRHILSADREPWVMSPPPEPRGFSPRDLPHAASSRGLKPRGSALGCRSRAKQNTRGRLQVRERVTAARLDP